jgi:uncharacterized Zn finger protein
MATKKKSNADPPDVALCPPCPKCQSKDTRYTVTTSQGHYCRCENCGHVWHDDTKSR